ncbi:MAG: hypothetical protein CVV44_19720 [Spirochaetae bacterium HGW-Spirochaetae-1]|jgi:antitoxin component YwqK of YwqJK toxin-antitoxin module|nr:MAG: hypothetical protein CVV44_19720 [Spirochaetae bacterium HGW-Spirochaetae-1]
MKKHSIFILTLLLVAQVHCASSQSALEDRIIDTSGADDITIMNGTAELHWSDGSLKATGTIKNGQRHGKWTYFHEGTEGKKIMYEGTFIYGKKNGIWISYFKNGNKQIRETYVNDTLHGSRLTFYESGMVHKEVWYRNGVKNGKFQEYYEDGKPMEICWYINDEKHGQSNQYYPNGMKKAIGNYEKGFKSGNWTLFNESGVIQSRGTYRDDQKTGTWTYFDEKGKAIELQ